MSIRHTVSNVLNRGRTPISELQPNREEIVHRMYTTLQKSCSKSDEPPKEKHIRNAIVQTHEARSSALFWQLAAKLPLAVNAHSCWKFSYLLHKLLREGHHSIFRQSQAYLAKLEELSRYWSHIQGYGPLILSYMKLLILKIEFHNKYEFLPGSLNPPSNIKEKVGVEPDAQFCFVLDALDYLEKLMETQKAIFRTMDRSKNSTSSASGHNRLCACIPIIADSEQLYSFCVKFLSLLHSQLPSEPLSGFRTRFLQIYNDLKAFYEQCVTILYIRQLIQVPMLPSSAPDFHSNIPEVNDAHQTLRRANQIEERPPSPEPSTTESLIDIDENHGFSQIQDDQFQIYAQLEKAQEEVSRLQTDLTNTKKEQTIEVTKLLEYISQLEREKLEAETSKLSLETNQATVNSLKTENQELTKKK
ncbi:Oidioi.mRNA.OKI2018_I69.PAR.g9543.t1.cds [Oikopleura dioica]|uniref:Oidioi.mRNA.OKI2018_I69.PAR.g9543.t1.cds n=1 Tax=Oikopleura dioica TaxID=34765 RepID=A0ABN7RRN0_OIKDI|nr:Oidioi.mRNA.OKI2018_I69.PAR.g9543.t1.cds [Oikopleura dioica]